MFVGPSDSAFPFSTGDSNNSDVTQDRALDTSYLNGGRRRLCFVSVLCNSTIASPANVKYTTQIGGQGIDGDGAGLAAGVVLSARFMVVFPVDPLAQYRVSKVVGMGASVSLDQWLEVDL